MGKSVESIFDSDLHSQDPIVVLEPSRKVAEAAFLERRLTVKKDKEILHLKRCIKYWRKQVKEITLKWQKSSGEKRIALKKQLDAANERVSNFQKDLNTLRPRKRKQAA